MGEKIIKIKLSVLETYFEVHCAYFDNRETQNFLLCFPSAQDFKIPEKSFIVNCSFLVFCVVHCWGCQPVMVDNSGIEGTMKYVFVSVSTPSFSSCLL